MKYIILTWSGGRLGNQLISLIHLLSFKIEHEDISFVNIPLSIYSRSQRIDDLRILCFALLRRTPQEHVLANKINFESLFFKIYLRLLPFMHVFFKYISVPSFICSSEYYHLFPTSCHKFFRHSKIINMDQYFYGRLRPINLLCGYHFRNYDLIIKHQKSVACAISSLFIQKNLFNHFLSCPIGGQLFVHLRGDDFAKLYPFYSYPIDKWIDTAIEIQSRMNLDSVVFSTDDRNIERKLNILLLNDRLSSFNFSISKGSILQTGGVMYSFSDMLQSSAILCLPSTLSIEASYLAGIPVYLMPEIHSSNTWKGRYPADWSTNSILLTNL